MAIAAAAVALLLVLIMKLKVHTFPALILVSVLTAIAAGIPTAQVVPVMLSGFGSTLASVALLVGLGAMLGILIQTSGGAQVLAHKLISVFGGKRAPIALGVTSMLFGFPIFFDAGLVVMLPSSMLTLVSFCWSPWSLQFPLGIWRFTSSSAISALASIYRSPPSWASMRCWTTLKIRLASAPSCLFFCCPCC